MNPLSPRRRPKGRVTSSAMVLVAVTSTLSCGLVLGREPNAPLAIQLEQRPSGEVTVKWLDASGAQRNETGFRVQRRIDAVEEFAEIATTPADVAVYTDAGIVPAVKYWYRVGSFNDEGESGFSAAVAITTATSSGTSNALLGNITGSGALLGGSTAIVFVRGNLDVSTYIGSVAGTSIGGDWSVASYTHNGGPVLFSGDDNYTTHVKTGNVFSTLFIDDPGKRVVLAAGATQTVSGALNFDGTADSPVSLTSSVPGERWFLDNQAAAPNVDGVLVQDGEVIGPALVATASIDAGNNAGWDFQL